MLHDVQEKSPRRTGRFTAGSAAGCSALRGWPSPPRRSAVGTAADGTTQPPVRDGLAPEAADPLRPAPDEGRVLAHPWRTAAELVVAWVLILGALFAAGRLITGPLADSALVTTDEPSPGGSPSTATRSWTPSRQSAANWAALTGS